VCLALSGAAAELLDAEYEHKDRGERNDDPRRPGRDVHRETTLENRHRGDGHSGYSRRRSEQQRGDRERSRHPLPIPGKERARKQQERRDRKDLPPVKVAASAAAPAGTARP